MKKQQYLVTLIINLHIYNQPFITSELAIKANQDVNNISFIMIFMHLFKYIIVQYNYKIVHFNE